MAGPDPDALAAVESSLRKRLDDWVASTSEFYARQRMPMDGGESWRSGLVGYLMRGPGALEHALADWQPPDEPS